MLKQVHSAFFRLHFSLRLINVHERGCVSWLTWMSGNIVSRQSQNSRKRQGSLATVKSSTSNRTVVSSGILFFLTCWHIMRSGDEVVGQRTSQRTLIRAGLFCELVAYKISPDKRTKLEGWQDNSRAEFQKTSLHHYQENKNFAFVLLTVDT